MRAFVTGACGFLGRHLLARLQRDGWEIVVYDRKPLLSGMLAGTAYIQGDVLEAERLTNAMQIAKPEVVFHLAALADVRSALKMPRQQLELNLLATFHVLEAMKAAQCSRIAFTSTAVVYGDSQNQLLWNARYAPIAERSYCFPQQTSIYGAMKLASESLIAAYCEGYGCIGDIYRLVSVVGPGYRHGNLMDFYTRLSENPSTLTLFGSPTQEKYYIAVEDVMDAIARTVARDHRGCDLWNVSHHAPNTIGDSISAVAEALGIPYPSVLGGASWPGDLPQLVLDCSKLRALGWVPRVNIREAMTATVNDLAVRSHA